MQSQTAGLYAEATSLLDANGLHGLAALPPLGLPHARTHQAFLKQPAVQPMAFLATK